MDLLYSEKFVWQLLLDFLVFWQYTRQRIKTQPFMQKKVSYLDLKQVLLQKIKENGGWVNAHAHFDRSFTITEENFAYTGKTLQEKWKLVEEGKREATVDTIYDRMAQSVELMLEQGVTAVGTFIDVDDIVQDRAIKAAVRIRDKYKMICKSNILIKCMMGC